MLPEATDTAAGGGTRGAGIARSGDLGFTSGPVEVGGKRQGFYFTVWKKQADGAWKWVYDGGAGAASAGEPPASTQPIYLPPSTARPMAPAKAMNEVRAAEAGLAAQAARDHTAAFAAVLALDARLYVAQRPAAVGRAAALAVQDAYPPAMTFSAPAGGEASRAGDLAYVYEQPVLTVLMSRLGNTMLLMVSSLTMAFTLGVALGAIAARRAYSWTDNMISTLGLVFYAMPSFFLSLLLILIFSVKLGWLPVGGIRTIGAFKTGWADVADVARHLVMPTAALSLIYLAFYMRLMRTSVLEVMDLDFVRTARAKGAGGARLMFHHVMRNALLPVVTLLGLQFSTVLGGSVIVETIFSLPGIGQLAYTSVVKRDLNTLMGIIAISSIIVVIVNVVTDLVYAWLDPRIELK